MNLKNMKKLTFDGVELKSLSVNGVLAWKSGYKNWVPLSINADGTIYNGGLGYKEGYRIRSGGAEDAQGSAVCTGFIPYRQGDILRIYPKYARLNSQNAFNFSDAEFNNLGQITSATTRYGICVATNYGDQWRTMMVDMGSQTGDITTLDISGIGNAGDIAYVRVTVPFNHPAAGDGCYVTSGADIIITVNEELEL